MTAPTTVPVGRLRRVWGRTRGPIAVIVLTAVMGFLLVGQLRGTEPFRRRLQAESEGDLTRILASLTGETDSLQDELTKLKLQVQQLQTEGGRDQSSADAANDQVRALQVLAGTVAVSGPGLVLTVEDPKNAVGYDTLIDIIQELRDAGAEAIAINDHRVGAASWLATHKTAVSLDGEVLAGPYRVAAIGLATTLEGGLKIPGGALDALQSLPGVHVETARSARLDLPALAAPPTFRSARPVPASGG